MKNLSIKEKIIYWFLSIGIVMKINTELWYFKNTTWPNHPWVKAWTLKKELLELECHSASVCNDPMNVCTGDFAEYYSRQSNSMEHELWSLNTPKWLDAIFDYFLQARSDELEESYYSAPWEYEPDLSFVHDNDGLNSDLIPY